MQVETLVHHVKPAARFDDRFDCSGMDLDNSVVADKNHDRELAVARRFQYKTKTFRVNFLRHFGRGKPQSLLARNAEFADQRKKVVRVLEFRPSRPKAFNIDFRIGFFRLFRRFRFGLDCLALVFAAVFFDQSFVSFELRVGLQKDLLNRRSALVEKLKTVQGSARRFARHGKGKLPVRKENPQIDIVVDG